MSEEDILTSRANFHNTIQYQRGLLLKPHTRNHFSIFNNEAGLLILLDYFS